MNPSRVGSNGTNRKTTRAATTVQKRDLRTQVSFRSTCRRSYHASPINEPTARTPQNHSQRLSTLTSEASCPTNFLRASNSSRCCWPPINSVRMRVRFACNSPSRSSPLCWIPSMPRDNASTCLSSSFKASCCSLTCKCRRFFRSSDSTAESRSRSLSTFVQAVSACKTSSFSACLTNSSASVAAGEETGSEPASFCSFRDSAPRTAPTDKTDTIIKTTNRWQFRVVVSLRRICRARILLIPRWLLYENHLEYTIAYRFGWLIAIWRSFPINDQTWEIVSSSIWRDGRRIAKISALFGFVRGSFGVT